MQNHLQPDRVITTSLLLAAIVLAGGCHGQRCNIFSGCHGCCQPCPYGCTDSACGGCYDEDCDECGGSNGVEPPVFDPPPLPATEGADANMPPDVSAKASPDSQRAKPNDIAPQTPRLAKRPQTDRPNTKNPNTKNSKTSKLKPPKTLPEQTPAKTISLEPKPAVLKDRDKTRDRDKTDDRTKTKPAANATDEKSETAPRDKGAPHWRTRPKMVDIVRPAASFGELFPDTRSGSKDSVSSPEKVRAAWYGERAGLLTVKQGRGNTSFAKKIGPAKKASLAKKISPAKKVTVKSTQATSIQLKRAVGTEKKHSTSHSTGHSTLRFRTKSVVTLKSAGQPPRASRPHASTSANPPSRLQSVRIRSVRR